LVNLVMRGERQAVAGRGLIFPGYRL